MDVPAKTSEKIAELYGESSAPSIRTDLAALLDRYADLSRPSAAERLSERDVMLITYGDSLHQTGKPPLNTLNLFAEQRLKDLVSIIHILPCFPYSSDDGFAVSDYRQLNPDLGEWHHLEQLADTFNLSFDLVLNHASSRSEYFRGFLRMI